MGQNFTRNSLVISLVMLSVSLVGKNPYFVFECSMLVISTEAADPDQGECSNTGDTNSQGQDSRANKIIVDCCHGVITSQSLFYLSEIQKI